MKFIAPQLEGYSNFFCIMRFLVYRNVKICKILLEDLFTVNLKYLFFQLSRTSRLGVIQHAIKPISVKLYVTLHCIYRIYLIFLKLPDCWIWGFQICYVIVTVDDCAMNMASLNIYTFIICDAYIYTIAQFNCCSYRIVW